MSEIPDKLIKTVSKKLRDQGVEETPNSVKQLGSQAFAKIRAAMRERGYQVPDGDLELLDWMKSIGL